MTIVLFFSLSPTEKMIKMITFNPRLSQIVSKVFLSKEHVTRAYKILLCLYLKKKKEMIAQNVTIANVYEGKYKKWNKILILD